MIYTVTFNPAIDYVMKLRSLEPGNINRSQYEKIYFGGKGINVSIILKQLGIESQALGFSAGFTGKAIEDGINSQGIKTDFVRLENGNSRINVKIKAETETELNGQGPEISADDLKRLFEKIEKISAGDTIILAGSIPDTLPKDIYEKILEKLSGKDIRFVIDATKDLLLNTLKYRPFLIKPNNYELEEIFNIKLKTNEEIIKFAKELQKMGALNVLVSMAGDGSILADETGNIHVIDAPKGNVVNSVGAGDSMVAGFIAGYIKTENYDFALKLGTAAGSATAFSESLAKSGEIEKLFKIINSK